MSLLQFILKAQSMAIFPSNHPKNHSTAAIAEAVIAVIFSIIDYCQLGRKKKTLKKENYKKKNRR